MTLNIVRCFQVPREIVETTERELRRAGADGYELFVLWSGVIDKDTFIVSTPHVPRQESFRLEGSGLVRVHGDALHKLNAWLYEAGQMLGVQIHAHPRAAFHSSTDDTFPIVTALGGLSIVAADFCEQGLLAKTTAAYRLFREGWIEQDLSVLEVF
ncbi:MAG: hypothetical protein Q7J73_09430 [Dehalococcoidales bacterium]|nr:hypothetical protein [Dehalococcoidales bacterium]